MSVQIKILSEKIAVEASRGARWRPPLLIFHRVVFFSAMSNFSTQAPVPYLSDNYVDLSDNYVDLSDDYVDLSDLFVDLSLVRFLKN